MEQLPTQVFNTGIGKVFCCKTFTSTIRHVAEIEASSPLLPSPRMLSYLDRLVTCANTGDISSPPRLEREKDDITLHAAKFFVKLYTDSANPNARIVYIVPSNFKKHWGSMIEICRGKHSFLDYFQEYAHLFAGGEDLYAQLKCAEHGSTWYAEIHRQKES